MGQSKEELSKVFKKMTFVNDNTPGNRRTYDPETGAELKWVSATPISGLYYYKFIFEGEKISLEAVMNTSAFDKDGKRDLHWEFFRLRLPEHMEDRRDEIAERVKQAFEAHGISYDRDGLEKITAEYKPL